MATPNYLSNGTITSYTLLSNISNGNAGLFNSIDSINLINSGNYYNYPPQIVITGGGGVGAEATAHLDTTTGKVGSINVYYSGSGYQNPPTIGIVGGGGANAAATATLSGGYVTTVNMSMNGGGYTFAPTVTFSAPTTSWGTTATGNAIIDGMGSVRLIEITNRGSGYITPPTVTISAPQTGNNQATVGYVAVSSIVLQSITVTNPGNGYTSTPAVTITPTTPVSNVNVPPLDPAGATASIGYSLANIQVTNQGQGYSSNANITVHIRGQGSIGNIQIANSGAGYSNTPTIIIGSPNDPHGQQAYAVAGLAQNSISNVLITNSGTGYTQPPSIQVNAAQNNYPTYSANLVAILNTGIGANANVTLLPYYTSDPVQGGSYYLRNNPFQTFTTNAAANFVGNVYIQATLSSNPAETDWFDVKKLNVVANAVTPDTIIGKFYWVRARIEDFAAGTINSLTVSYPYNT